MGGLAKKVVTSENAARGAPQAPARLVKKPHPNEKPGIRRAPDRREPKTERGSSRLREAKSDRPLYLPDSWWLMAVAPLIGLVSSSIAQASLPPLVSAATLALAAMIFGSSFWASRWEREQQRDSRTARAVAFAVTILPTVILGFGFAYWVVVANLSIAFGVATLICVNALSASILSGRVPLMFACKLAAWAPLALISGDKGPMAALALVVIGLVLLTKFQLGIDKKRDEHQQADARILTRAIDILTDYEETEQGWFWETDRRGQLTYISDAVAKRIEVNMDELIGRPITALFDLNENNQESERTITFHLSARSAFQELAVRASASKEERWWSISGRPIYDSFHNFCGFRGSGTDLTEKKRSQENASRLAHFDSLTGLANRHQMSQTLEKILASPQEANRECSVFLLDLDRFKHVNDTLGHPAGDALLKQVAQRLERAVGKLGRVGRLGGDEFKVILPGRNPRQKLTGLAAEIIQSLSQPYSIEGQRVVIGASIGIAVSPDDGESSDDIIRNSDLALYAAKDGGRGRYHFYSSDLHSAAEERSKLEQDLRDAISDGQFELHYQPVVHTATERLSGFEALLRWNHHERGYISPEKFIPIAEDTGLIQAIGEWALRSACADLAKWPEEIRCAVNVSPIQFSNPQLPAIITNAIAQAGISPSRLELEITESVFLNNDEGTDAMFAALKGIGVRLALDDFGTGYSSLGYLKTAPFDKIKIDQSFVRGATKPGSRNGAIIASITSLAQALGMDTTAEGVETLDELDLVRMHGCSHIQGYIYDKPLTVDVATMRIQTGHAAIAAGPKSARAVRQTVLRRVVIEHGDQHYVGTIRNLSSTGCLIEGLWNVPPGTIFRIALTEQMIVTATTRWSKEDRMGTEFATPIPESENGRLTGLGEDTTFSLRKKATAAG
ncbi:EAL domain-containing protein [Altererythrobacter sp.]|nr:EAL domain-containing protein [Altererythrobacter sp.]